jgi:type I restriction enzyme M protein
VKEINKMAEKQKLKMVLLKDLIDKKIIKHYTGHGSPPAKFKGMGNTPYIRVADIMNWDVYKNPVAMIPEEVYLEKKGKNGIDLNDNDILFVRRGSYRIGTVAMVSPYDKKVLLTKEISIFRIIDEKNKYDINPYYLIYLFSHELTQKQLNNKVLIETTLPNIANRWEELYLPISKNKKKRVEIITNMKKVFDKKWEAQKEIQNLRDKFGNLTT